MKKNFLWSMMAFMMVTVFSISFTSCGGDDNEGNSSSYNLTDEQALDALQGTWNVITTEYDEEEGDETWSETWEISGSKLNIIRNNYTWKYNFIVKDGIFSYGNGTNVSNYEKHQFVKLNSSRFETSDAAFHNGKMIIKMVGTKK